MLLLGPAKAAVMGIHERRTAYAAFWVFALAFGWIEALTVAYLREIYTPWLSLSEPSDFAGLPVTLIALPNRLVVLEMVREGCTIILLGAVAWLAGRRLADRAGAFLLSFGVWDLTYYGALRLVLGWPDSLGAWDILFLIPVPWVAPVWAPVVVAALFVAAGSHLFWTAERERRYRWPDFGVLAASVLLTIAAFLVESGAAIDQREPERFPVWLFSAGVALGTAWFLRMEQRAVLKEHERTPWVGTRVRPIAPAPSEAAREPPEIDSGAAAAEYRKAKTRLDALLEDAGDWGERLDRLAQGLSAHPARMIIGVQDGFIENPSEWDIVPSHPLPSEEQLAALTNEIREVEQKVEDLRERLILTGHADLVERPDRFFH